MTFADWLSFGWGPNVVWSDAICRTLTHSVWQVTLATIAAAVLGRCRPRDPSWNHGVYLAAIVITLTAVAGTFIRQLERPSSNRIEGSASPMVMVSDRSDSPRSTVPATPQSPADGPRALDGDVSRIDRLSAEGSPDRPIETGLSSPTPPPIQPTAWRRWIAGLYASGVAFMSIRLGRSWWRGYRRRRGSRPINVGTDPDGPVWLRQWRQLLRPLRWRTAPRLLVTAEEAVPQVVGVLRPVVLVPLAMMSQLAPEQVQTVLAHELAHIKRGDGWVVWVQRIGESVLFFHPGFWWLSRRLTMFREQCCDRSVIATTGVSPGDYAHLLLRIAERLNASGQPSLSMAITTRTPSMLRRRVAALLHPAASPMAPSSYGGGGLLLVAAFVVVVTFGGPTVVRSETDLSNGSLPGVGRRVADAFDRTFDTGGMPKLALLYRSFKQDAGKIDDQPFDLSLFWQVHSRAFSHPSTTITSSHRYLIWDRPRLLATASFEPQKLATYANDVRYWDGRAGWVASQSTHATHTVGGVDRYDAIDDFATRISRSFYPHWNAMGGDLPWPGEPLPCRDFRPLVSDAIYRKVATESLGGRKCEVVDCPDRAERVWISVDDGLIRAIAQYKIEADSEKRLGAYREATGGRVTTWKELTRYRGAADEQERLRVEVEMRRRLWDDKVPRRLWVFGGHREVAVGLWLPHRIDTVSLHPDEPWRCRVTRTEVSSDRDFDLADQLGRLAPGLAESIVTRQRPVQPQPPTSVREAIDILTEEPGIGNATLWGGAVRLLVERPEVSLPLLIEALDGETRDHPITKLTFVLRAIGDRRAVPALIRAIPRTLQPARGDCLLDISNDVALRKFLQRHDLQDVDAIRFTYRRAFPEVVGTLRRLTGLDFGGVHLNNVSLPPPGPRRRLAQRQFIEFAARWATGWRQHLGSKAPPIELPEPPAIDAVAVPDAFPSLRGEPMNLTSGGVLNSALETSRFCLYDLDTGRTGDWPSHLSRPVSEADDRTAFEAWARREGFDVVCLTRVDEDGQRYHYLHPVGTKVWKVRHDRRPGVLRDLVVEVDSMTPRDFSPALQNAKLESNRFVFVTAEGTAGEVRLVAQKRPVEAESITDNAFGSAYEAMIEFGGVVITHSVDDPSGPDGFELPDAEPVKIELPAELRGR